MIAKRKRVTAKWGPKEAWRSCVESEKILAAPQGFEPRYADPESAVLPLNEGAAFAGRAQKGPSEPVFIVEAVCSGRQFERVESAASLGHTG